MGTNVRSTMSEKNKYWIEKHRYYELKHFVMQYPIWVDALKGLTGLAESDYLKTLSKTNNVYDPTVRCAEARDFYIKRIDLVENTALEADKELGLFVLTGITEELTYDKLRAKYNIPCCRNSYYEVYRRFFWILNKSRN